MKHLKTTAGFFLLVHAFHLASLQNSTDSPGRTIDKSWLRERAKNAAETPNAAVPEDEVVYDHGVDAMESSNDDSSGIPSGSMFLFSGDEENLAKNTNNTSDVNDSPTFENGTNNRLEPQDATVPPNTTTAASSDHINMTKPEQESNSTLTPRNPTGLPDVSNHTDLPSTSLAPESNSTKVPGKGRELTSSTESTNTTTTTTAAPEINQTSSMTSSTAAFPSETTEMTTAPTSTAAAPVIPEKANKTDKGASSGGNSDRGLASDSPKSRRKGAWGVVLGTAVAVACVGVVAYIIMKKKYQKGFSHRKLVEEYPSDPVLRLDNCHLDLNFGGGSAYYNPALQGDNIQMSNIPGRR